jgi:hypothetical protein
MSPLRQGFPWLSSLNQHKNPACCSTATESFESHNTTHRAGVGGPENPKKSSKKILPCGLRSRSANRLSIILGVLVLRVPGCLLPHTFFFDKFLEFFYDLFLFVFEVCTHTSTGGGRPQRSALLLLLLSQDSNLFATYKTCVCVCARWCVFGCV